jgi:putative SOS response-associated peptidase YedK
MCGRFTLRADPKALNELLPVFEQLELFPRYNIAPSQDVLAVRQRQEATGPEAATLRWGLVPHWAKDAKHGSINARAETLAGKPMFRSAYRKRRCLIPADGFYEWQKVGKAKQPFYIRMKDDQPFAFAGLWEHWEHDGEIVNSCAIVTTRANEILQPFHDRMPVILERAAYERWLDADAKSNEDLEPLLRPYSSEAMTAFGVSTLVNNARHEEAGCIEPLAA